MAIADERELRGLVRPEEWCAHESMTNSLAVLQQQGVSQQDKLLAMPIDRLRIAAEQLSPPEVSILPSLPVRILVYRLCDLLLTAALSYTFL